MGFRACRQLSRAPLSERCRVAYEGWVDVLHWGVVGGWARDTTRNDPLVLDVLMNGKLLGQSVAGGYRDELQERTDCDAMRGFWFELKEPLKNLDQIRVRVAGTDHFLPIRPDPISIHGRRPDLCCRGWAKRRAAISKRRRCRSPPDRTSDLRRRRPDQERQQDFRLGMWLRQSCTALGEFDSRCRVSRMRHQSRSYFLVCQKYAFRLI